MQLYPKNGTMVGPFGITFDRIGVQVVKATVIGSDGFPGVTATVPLSELEPYTKVESGVRDARQGQPAWKCDDQYAMFNWERYTLGRSAMPAMLVVCHIRGDEQRWFLLQQRGIRETITSVFMKMTEPVAWDVLSAIIGSYDHGRKSGEEVARTCERERLRSAFVTNRLRRKKESDGYRVWIEPEGEGEKQYV